MLSALRPGAVVIEMSSGAPAATQALAARVAEAGGALIDAPVSGGVKRAETGELAIMVGGDPNAIDRAETLLKRMGTSIMRTGPVGSAHAMKALNNLAGGRRLPARDRGAADRPALRPRPGAHGRRAERLHRDEQQQPEEVQAIRAVALVRRRVRPGPDGEGSRHRGWASRARPGRRRRCRRWCARCGRRRRRCWDRARTTRRRRSCRNGWRGRSWVSASSRRSTGEHRGVLAGRFSVRRGKTEGIVRPGSLFQNAKAAGYVRDMLSGGGRSDGSGSAFRFRNQDLFARLDAFFEAGEPVFELLDVSALLFDQLAMIFFRARADDRPS